MRTADDVEITDGLRLWTDRLDPATADLAARGAGRAYADGWVVVRTDDGRTVMIDAESTAVAHPATGKPPSPLGGCRWAGAEVHQAAGSSPCSFTWVSEAAARLRAHAVATDRPELDVARDIIAHRLQLPVDAEHGPPPDAAPDR